MKKLLAASVLALALAGCQSTQPTYYDPGYTYRRPLVVPPLPPVRPTRVCYWDRAWNPYQHRYVPVERCNLVYR